MGLLLAIKLLFSPLLIGLASLAGKRWGPNIAGLLGGLPLVAGPIVLALWLQSGTPLVIEVSRAAPVGVWATMVYLLTVGYASARLPWHLTLLVGWVAYLASAVALQKAGLAHNALPSVAILPGLWLAATRWLPRPAAAVRPARLPAAELGARMLAAVALVLGLTGAAEALGPEMTGVLVGGPVAATVIPAFIMARDSRDALLLALRGFLTGLIGFALFFLILGHAMAVLGVFTVPLATIVAVGAGLLATAAMRRVLPPAAPRA